MREQVSLKVGSDRWDEWWEELQSEFFKCETLPKYTVEGEEDMIALYRNGELEKLRSIVEGYVSPKDSIWNTAKARGVSWRRVHVFERPLSEYLRFEIEVYRVQAVAEEIWMVPLDRLPTEWRPKLQDFQLFDLKRAFIGIYDDIGRPTNNILSDDPDELAKLVEYRNKMIEVGIPLAAFKM